MPAGIQLTQTGIDNTIGTVARNLNIAFDEVRQIHDWLAAQQDSDLTALGYDSTDIANIRGAFDDLDQLRTIYEGTAALASAKDFRAYPRWLWGLGF